MFLLKDENNRVISTANIIETREEGYYISEQDCIYPFALGLIAVDSVEIPLEVVQTPQAYFYDNGVFTKDTDWKPYIPPEERIAQLEIDKLNLQTQLASTNTDLQALMDYLAEAGILI